MNAGPFFSVLIPTKNRAHLVGYAIQSVLDQSFSDFEIVVMDNDDGDRTRAAVANFTDNRVRYCRSGGLNMSENWERALGEATGQFVTVLEDKQAYYPFALKAIYDAIYSSKCDVIVWEWDIYDDRDKQGIATDRSESAQVMSSNDVLAIYISSPSEAGKYMPRMLNSAIRRDICIRIKDHPNVERFFAEVSPDLCASFYALAFVDDVNVLHRALGLVGYLNLSNAVRGRRSSNSEIWKYYGDPAATSADLSYVPIKSLRLTYNSVYNDYLRIRNQVGGRLLAYKMDVMSYAKVCLWDAVRMYGSGADRSAVIAECMSVLRYIREQKVGLRGLVSLALFGIFLLKMTLMKIWNRARRTKWQGENIYEAVRSFGRTPEREGR